MKKRIHILLFSLLALCFYNAEYVSFIQAGTSIGQLTGDSADNHTAITQLSTAPLALPVQVEKIQITIIHLAAKQLQRRLSQTVFGLPAKQIIEFHIQKLVTFSHTLIISLPSANISFPFSAFW